MVESSSPSLGGDPTLAAFRHWLTGFALQTLVYGINVSVFLMSIWVLAIHIIKAYSGHRFHRSHLTQNSALLLYAVIMFALSTVFMGHQGMLAGDAWSRFLPTTPQSPLPSPRQIIDDVFDDRVGFLKACTVISILVNWGTVGMLLWRAIVHWKIHSIFPVEIMILPSLFFAACIATDLLYIIQATLPDSLSVAAQHKDWRLISWAMSTALYYLLAILISLRVLYHRRVIRKQCGTEDVNKFTGYLSIFYDSGALVLAFATAYLVILTGFSDLYELFQSLVPQMEVLLSLLIVQRLADGRAWTGKTIDCIMNMSSRKLKQEVSRHLAEEVTTMGFNPNTEFSSTQNGDVSEHSQKGGHHEVTTELQEVVRSNV